MNRINEFTEILDIVVNTKKAQSLICGSGLAAAMFEHKEFSYLEMQYKTFLTPMYHGGGPYTVGYLGNIKINIDPELKYDNMCLYDSKGMLIYNFNKFKLIELI